MAQGVAGLRGAAAQGARRGRDRDSPAQATLAAVEKDEGPVWWVARFRLGEGTDEAGLARALALEDPDRARRMNVCPTFVAELIHR